METAEAPKSSRQDRLGGAPSVLAGEQYQLDVPLVPSYQGGWKVLGWIHGASRCNDCSFSV